MFASRLRHVVVVGLIVLHVVGFSRACFAQEQGGEIPGRQVLTITAGTPVIMETTAPMESKNYKEGDTVFVRVRVPVKVKDIVVIRAGVMGRAVVTDSKSASSWGGAGELAIDAKSVPAIDGSEVMIGGNASRKGDSSGGTAATVAVGAGIICLPLALTGAVVKGDEGKIKAGYELVARVIQDTRVTVPSEAEEKSVIRQQEDDAKRIYEDIRDKNRIENEKKEKQKRASEYQKDDSR